MGVGTGIVARQFQAAGCQVLGVDPDARLAEFARHTGMEVEVSTFEAWEAAGRKFDAVVSGGELALGGPGCGGGEGGPGAAAWMSVGRVLEHGPAASGPRGSLRRGLSPSLAGVARRPPGERSIEEAHSAMCAKAADGMQATGAFDEPEQWRFEWAQSYTRDEWLDALQTSGGAIPESQLAALLEGVGAAIDALGGSFTMNYVTFVVTAVRRT